MSFSLLLLSTCLAWFFTSHLDKQKSSTGPKRGLLPVSEDIVADLNVVLTISFFNIFYLSSFFFHILGHRLSSSQFRLHVKFPWWVSKTYRWMGSTQEILNELVWDKAQISLIFRHSPGFLTCSQGWQTARQTWNINSCCLWIFLFVRN